LTWHAIQEALPKLGKRGRPRSKAIRSGLLEVGNVFAEQGLLPSWNSYLWERRLAQYVESAPEISRVHVSGFEKWASQGMVNPKLDLPPLESSPLANTTEAILETVKAVVIFLNWCAGRNIFSLADIDQVTIANYKENLFWQRECKTCRKRTPLDFSSTNETCSNKECNAVNSNVRVRRLARASVTRMAMNLRVFFNWAQLHDIVVENPLEGHTGWYKGFTITNQQGEMIEIADSIRRYNDDVVESLCSYIVSPDADPEEALVLYLIIFHLLTVTELCNAKIPSLVAAGPASADDFDRAKDFEHLLLPVCPLSRGQLSTKRHDSILKFPKGATSWLVPLLKRYFEKRGRAVSSEYLFTRHRQVTRHSRPVSRRYIALLVNRASLRVLKGTVNPRDLRGTAAAILAQRSKRRGAILTKLGYKNLRATRYNYLETYHLAPRTTTTSTGR
jgi:site-specific recombinase XerC